MTGAAGAVAKKKKPGPKPSKEGPRESLIALKCRDEYKVWVSDFSRKLRTTPSQLIDQALVAFAESKGFKPPPER
jgi:hypothetical protein